MAIYNSKSSFIFTDTNRNDLTHLVLDRESDGFVVNPPIKPARFIELAHGIVQLFPRELVGTYYTPHVNKTQFSKGITAKGKLLYHHNFRRAKQRKALKLLKQQNQDVVSPEHADEEFNDKLNFLYEHLEPWPEVVANWEHTYETQQKILKNLNDIKAYYNRFPCLKQSLGYELLKIDFEKRFPNKTTCLRDKWPVFKDCIIRLLQTTRTPKNSMLANIVTADLPILQGDALDTTVLWILSAMLKKSTPMFQDITPDKPAKRGRKSKHISGDPEEENLQWNPSTAEVQ
ncbi:uncharacterized protein LOC130674693 [Microplitis mediator]|uniref:uncharacterized protein LOC130674693 n=1 Tax=Microplitis mediator TaxID=375433 RepID=UPI0025533357|nr:uncharacterized protein LOC130674693 [Microplitis mediator]